MYTTDTTTCVFVRLYVTQGVRLGFYFASCAGFVFVYIWQMKWFTCGAKLNAMLVGFVQIGRWLFMGRSLINAFQEEHLQRQTRKFIAEHSLTNCIRSEFAKEFG